ncbi:MAG: DUF2490 domain-containing protein [Muribaculaceae bacterium]|nr:DUF2490 domain-containing protein [Muribaculaceae bacterium]
MKQIVKLAMAMALCIAVALPARAQFDGKEGRDFGLWMTAGVEKKINKKWSVGVEFEFRLKDNIEEGKSWGAPNRWSIGIGADYKPLSWLKLDAGYKFMRDYSLPEWDEEDQEETEAYWGTKHRVYASATGSYKVQNVKFSLRERWQYTYRCEVPDVTYDWEHDRLEPVKAKGKHVSRTKLQISYDKKKAWYEPYVSVELYAAKKFEKMRYTAGCEFKVNKHNIIDVFYRYQDINGGDNYNDRDSHILGIGYLFKF